MKKVVAAIDKFKGSLTAQEVGELVARQLESSGRVTVLTVPIADGGDGTLSAMSAAGAELVDVTCTGPTGEPVSSQYAVMGDRVVVEMAAACGISLLPGGLEPLKSSSHGLGEVIAAALDAGYRDITIGIGGSASTDAGSGMLVALGARLLDESGVEVPLGAGGLVDVAQIDFQGLHPALSETKLTVAVDVSNPLLGEQGAAAIFGPQKGVTPELFDQVEGGVARFAELVVAETGTDARDTPGAGAAGGVGWALMNVLNATPRPGIELVLDLADFAGTVADADLVVTGEGLLDEQTLLGKAPAGVAAAAKAAGVRTVALCGENRLSADQMAAAGFDAAYSLRGIEPDLEVCMREAPRLLRQVTDEMISTEFD